MSHHNEEKKQRVYFVAGITGHTGSATAHHLHGHGHKVRTILRDPAKGEAWTKRGVEVRKGDLTDVGAITSALEGVHGAYLMVPPFPAPSKDFSEAKAIIKALREAVGKAKPPHLVILTSIGAEEVSGTGVVTPLHTFEEAFSDLDIPVAFIRAAFFLENTASSFPGAEATGMYYTMYSPTDKKLPMIAADDIGSESARLLVMGFKGKTIVELGTPYSFDEVAAAMGKAVGKEVKAASIPRDQWAPTLEKYGFKTGTTWAYEELFDAMLNGKIKFNNPGTVQVAGKTTPTEFYEKLKKAQAPGGK